MNTRISTTRRISMLLAAPAIVAVLVIVAAINTDEPRPVSAAPAKAEASDDSPVRFTKDGELLQPTGYRKWTYVGTPLTPNDMNDGKAAFPEFHSVYMNPKPSTTTRRPASSPTEPCWSKSSSASAPSGPAAARDTSWATSSAWRSP